MTTEKTLRLFLPGAFANLADGIRTLVREADPGVDLWIHEFLPSGMLAAVHNLPTLFESGLTVVIPQSDTDHCRQYVVRMLARAGLTETAAMHERDGRLLHSRGSGDLPSFLFEGRAGAGIFYASEAAALGARVTAVDLPPDLDMRDEIRFKIGAVEREGGPHPRAASFVDLMCGEGGQRLLTEAGFLAAS